MPPDIIDDESSSDTLATEGMPVGLVCKVEGAIMEFWGFKVSFKVEIVLDPHEWFISSPSNQMKIQIVGAKNIISCFVQSEEADASQ